MKKFLALALTLVLALSLGVSVFAATTGSVSGDSTTVAGTATSDVTVSVTATSTVYKVDVSWTDVAVEASIGGWDTTNHKYGDVTWTNNTVTIQVKNHSNAAVVATATFAAKDEYSGVTCIFTNNGATIASADQTTYHNQTENAPSNDIIGTIGGTLPSTASGSITVGTITVTITAPIAN